MACWQRNRGGAFGNAAGARPVANYRVVMRVEYLGNACSRDIESADQKLHRIVRNECRAQLYKDGLIVWLLALEFPQ